MIDLTLGCFLIKLNSYLCFETEAGNRVLIRFTSVSGVLGEYSVVIDALVQRVLLRAAILLGGGRWSGTEG